MSAGCLILYKDGHGAKLQEKNVEITENGSTTVIPNNRFNGLSKVNITTNVSLPPPVYQDKTISILENTQTEITPDSGYDALSKVTVNVNVPEDEWASVLQTSLTEGHGEWQKQLMLEEYQKTANVFKNWTSIPSTDNKYKDYKYIPNLPLPSSVDGLFYRWVNIVNVPSFLDFSQYLSLNSLFRECYSLKTFVQHGGPWNCTDAESMFNSCKSLQGSVTIDMPSCIHARAMFAFCSSIEEITLNTAPLAWYSQIFDSCALLVTINNLNLSEDAVHSIRAFAGCPSLTNINFAEGSVINAENIDFHESVNLTVQSLLNILNILKDLTGMDSKTLTLGSENLNKLTDEQKAIATNKNWVLQ